MSDCPELQALCVAPLPQDLNITFGGLRQFRVPIRQDYQVLQSSYDNLYNGVRYVQGCDTKAAQQPCSS
jgi:hypothetical protein